MNPGRSLLPAAFLTTVALAAAGLLAPSHPTPPSPAIATVPRIDPNMEQVNRQTREALDACHARGSKGAGVLVVVAPDSDGLLAVHLHGNAPGVCAYRVDD